MDLFESANQLFSHYLPLAERMRPTTLDEVIGHEQLLQPGKILRQAIETDKLPSIIFWGSPGSGKTTIARLMARYTGAVFQAYSAVTSGIKEMKEVLHTAKELFHYQHRRTILFIDEIHRFNKAQQDAFLPFVEQGTIILIGATTENPSFEINAALLSRCSVFTLPALTEDHLLQILKIALATPERGLGHLGLRAEEAALQHLASAAFGDARCALNNLELASTLAQENKQTVIDIGLVEAAIQKKFLRYDKAGEEHFNHISALHKSIRGSDPDAALYWLARMLEAGEDPHFLLRRMARMASEDIGLANPQALVMASACKQAFDFIGLPEGKLTLAELAVYLSLSPKSNALETGYYSAQETILKTGDLPVPLHIRNAPTALMKKLGYGKDYRYAHDFKDHWVPDDFLPDSLIHQQFYQPGTIGWEGKMKPTIDERRQIKEKQRKHPDQRPEL